MFGTKIVEKIVNDPKDAARIKELENQLTELKNKTVEDKLTHEMEVKSLKHDQSMAIERATSDKDKEITAVKLENMQLKTKVEILEKAFENMGFDVKDMKDILNKLVDGMVEKHKINVIK